MSFQSSDTITFLFTDIEGSTKLWEQQPNAMSAALTRHDAIVRGAIEGCGGRVFKTVGDAFCAAFDNALDALTAALAAQQALVVEVWPGEIPAVRARMALHTGTAEQRDNDYFGPPLNRLARLLAAGYGGQTLLSLATQELVRDALPPGTSLIDLGQHRLKDLFRPEHIYQLAAPNLPIDFPPLRTLDAKLSNLPAQPTPLVGREREVAAVLGLLRRPDVRLVTLTGPGGTGKTRLSLQVAADLIEDFQHGVWFVELAAITEPDLVLLAIAGVLGLKETGNRLLSDLVREHLRDLQLLLVLDNFEQVVKAAPIIADLLRAAPKLKIITSSREVLRLSGEHDYPVPPLGLPDLHKKQTTAVLSQYEAVALFIQRAKAVHPAFEISDENAPAVAEICVRLDGLPLAIELAAARSRLLPPQALLERLSSRLQVLASGARDLPVRQQTIRGTIDWSYHLLDEGEKTLFAQLAVFLGGWSMDAAEQICSLQELSIGVLDGLESLEAKSLIQSGVSVTGQPRFWMLETIREYALERLRENRVVHALHAKHAAFYLLRIEAAVRGELDLGTARTVSWTHEEYDNLRAALTWAIEHAAAETALRLCIGLYFFWERQGKVSEGRRFLSTALGMEGDAPLTIRAGAMRVWGNLLTVQTEYEQAKALYKQSLEMCRQAGDPNGVAANLNNLANVATYEGAYAESRQLYQQCLDLQKQIGNEIGVAQALGNMAEVAIFQADYGDAEALYAEALLMMEQSNTRWAIRWLRTGLGGVQLSQGRYAEARANIEGALAQHRSSHDLVRIREALCLLGEISLKQGRFDEARQHYIEALEIAGELGDRLASTFVLEGLAGLSAAISQPQRAVRLYAAAGRQREILHSPLPPAFQAARQEAITLAREGLDLLVFHAVWAEGEAMSLEEVVEYALNEDSI